MDASPRACAALLVLLSGCVTRTDLFGDEDQIEPASCPDVGSAELGAWQNVTPADLSLMPGGANRGVITVANGRPGEVFIGTTYQGLWRSRDCGATWSKVNTGAGAQEIDGAEMSVLTVDPQAPEVLYVMPNFIGGGIWQSSNSGVDWQSILPTTAVASVNPNSYIELAGIAVDPHDSNHLVTTFTSAWIGAMGHGGQDSGVVEGHFDGLNWTWDVHEPGVGMGTQHTITFLADSDSWLVVTRWEGSDAGTWRTINGGASFEKVSDNQYSTNGGQAYRVSDSLLFHSGLNGLFRIENNGATHTDVLGTGTNGVAGDGERVFVSSNEGDGTAEPRLFVGKLTDGLGDFDAFGASDTSSAHKLAVEPQVGALYSINGLLGVRRLRVR